MIRPTEQELRRHFGTLLNPDAVVETIKYTAIWAADDGTLLWDPKSGYADLTPKVKTLVYVTYITEQIPGASLNFLKYDKLINRDMYINVVDLSRVLPDMFRQHENIVVTSSVFIHATESGLRRYAERNKIQFINILI